MWVEGSWSDTKIELCIQDDGPGYPSQIIDKIGEPFVRKRALTQETETRPEYEGMGLGLFIAKTLLERTGAKLRFSNSLATVRKDPTDMQAGGAIVELTWPIDTIKAHSSGPLGQNQPLES